LSDEDVGNAIYDSCALHKFVGIDFLREQVSDATTLLHFRHLLEESQLGRAMLEGNKRFKDEIGHLMHGGTIVDATIINAPSSTKNAKHARDPEMHQTKKGKEWRFGIKKHVGVDAGTGVVVTVEATVANVHDVTVASKPIREDATVVDSDSGYLGTTGKRPEIAEDEHRKIDSRINRRPGKLRRMKDNGVDWERFLERRKSSVRSKVEHPFRFLKIQCDFCKTVYRRLGKNFNRALVLFASSNLHSLARAGRRLAMDWA
jgi:IS5 family transposase